MLRNADGQARFTVESNCNGLPAARMIGISCPMFLQGAARRNVQAKCHPCDCIASSSPEEWEVAHRLPRGEARVYACGRTSSMKPLNGGVPVIEDQRAGRNPRKEAVHFCGYVLPKCDHIETSLCPKKLWSEFLEARGRDQHKLLEHHESHQECHIFLRECDTFPGGTSEECSWGRWGSCPSIFPILLGTTSSCGYCTRARCIRRIGLDFIRVHSSHAPTAPSMFLAGGWRSIDHSVTPEANLVLVAVSSPRIESIFPVKQPSGTVDGTSALRVMRGL